MSVHLSHPFFSPPPSGNVAELEAVELCREYAAYVMECIDARGEIAAASAAAAASASSSSSGGKGKGGKSKGGSAAASAGSGSV